MNLILPNLQAQPPVGAPADPLAQLNDILLPEQLNSYVIAPGWILVFLFILTLIAGLFVAWKWFEYKRRFKKVALKELNQWYDANKSTPVNLDNLRYLNGLIKRYAITITGRKQIANLFGDRWQQFLIEYGHFEKPCAHLFAHGQYQCDATIDESLETAVQQCQRFIKTYDPKQSTNSISEGVVNA